MAFTRLRTTQKVFLHDFLRGTGKSLTEREAESKFQIRNLRARISELRDDGLIVRKQKTESGRTRYFVSARDIWGSKAKYYTCHAR